MDGDALWYEAAQVVGITNALNVAADGLGASGLTAVEPARAPAEVRQTFDEIRAFFGGAAEVPAPFRLIAHDPGYLADVWGAARHAFADNRLGRRLKAALAFAVSLTTRSPFGSAFHLAEMRRLGVTQMFSSYTKIADTLQLESDMGAIAPVDPSPAPGH